jgi:hypothetical protein
MSKIAIWITTAILLAYFVFTSGLVYETTGSEVTDRLIVPYSAALSGERTGLFGVYTEDDIRCAEWLAYESDTSIPIVGDGNTWLLMKGYVTQSARVMLVPPPIDITNEPMFTVYSDSLDDAYISLVAKATGLSANNLSIQDAELADMLSKVYRSTVVPSTLSIMLLGTNDAKHFGNNAVALTCFEYNLYSYLVKLGILTSDIIYAQDDSIVYTGTWGNIDVGWGNHSKFTTKANATASFSVKGSIIYIDTLQSCGGTKDIKVEIDGVDMGIFGGKTLRQTILMKGANITHAPYLLRFAGLENTVHKVVLTAISDKWCVWFNWVAATDGSLKDAPYVYVGNCLPSKGNESAADSYNAVIENCVKTLVSDGLRVILVDVYASINKATDLSLDGYLNNFGHRHIADAFLLAITPESIARIHVANNRGDLYYIFLRTWNTEYQKLVGGGASAGMREIKDLSEWKLDLYKEAFRSGKAIVYERK